MIHNNPTPHPIEPRSRQSWRERRDDPRRGTIQVAPRTGEPRPASTPVPETTREWRPREFKF